MMSLQQVLKQDASLLKTVRQTPEAKPEQFVIVRGRRRRSNLYVRAEIASLRSQ